MSAPTVEVEAERDLVADMVRTCTRCDLHKQCKAPVPFRGPTPADIAIVGEAPGSQEDEAGRPFIGPAGKLLANLLTEVGFDTKAVFICNTVQCYPHGTPTAEQVTACNINKLAQLDLANPKWVLLLGGTALSGYLSHPISKARARPFAPGGGPYVCFATYHPAAALRKRAYEMEMKGDLEVFKSMVDHGFERWASYIPDRCIACSNHATWFDLSGVGTCDTHMPAEGHARQEFIRNDYLAACRRLEAPRDH